tara:strand:+ start:439 stop:624 length:186 start_codon:yes stop_codon:yes gene_type:complete
MIVTLECPVTVVFQADVEDPSNIQPEEIDDAAFGEAVYYQILKANPVTDLNCAVIEVEALS